MPRADLAWRLLFAAALAAVGWVSLLPQSDIGSVSFIPDFISHAVGYALLGLLAVLATHGWRPIVVGGLLIGYGIILEILQPIVADRLMSTSDVVANAVGVILGVSGGWLLTTYRYRRQ